MPRRIYHGWIYVEKTPGMRDSFYVMQKDAGAGHHVGYGEAGAQNAVDYFEKDLQLGHVRLESTPLGLRVFTYEKGAEE